MTEQDCIQLYEKAHLQGALAASEKVCRPMTVIDPASGQRWHVPDGVCGFAWIVVKPGNSAFARWLKKRKLADTHYYGGVSIWVTDYSQSMQLKETYAAAFAAVIQQAGITCYSESRMD